MPLLLNPYFYKPFSLAKSSNNIYILCKSSSFLLFKIVWQNNVFKLSSNFPKKVEYRDISNAWDLGYLVVLNKLNIIQLKSNSGEIIAQFKFDNQSKYFELNQSFKKNKFLISYAFSESKANVLELELLNGKFIITRKKIIDNILSVNGIAMINDEKFLISDELSGVVSEHSFSHDKVRIICNYGRNGNGLTRLPGKILVNKDKIFICDRHNYLIQQFNLEGSFIQQIGGKGSKSNKFDLPSDILKIDDTNFLIADQNNDRASLFNMSNFEIKDILLKRNYLKGKLARPTSFCQFEEVICIADRDNDCVQVFDMDLKYKRDIRKYSDSIFMKRPTSVASIKINRKNVLAVLDRGDNNGNVKISLFDNKFKFINHKYFSFFNDPQGMISVGDQFLCISDTRNRKGVLLNNELKVINSIKLDVFSNDARFLCRVPSLVGNEIWFVDYKSGVTVKTDKKLNFKEKFKINKDLYKLRNVRRIYEFMNGLILLGVSKDSSSSIVFVKGRINNKNFISCPEKSFVTPVDFLSYNMKNFILEKEGSKLEKFDLSWISDFNK